MSDLVPVRRALLSVSDKTGLVPFAAALVGEFGVELLSTGGTASALRDAGLPVTDIAAVTGFPEMMDGRVKTLHPAVHGALLGLRDHPEHAAAMRAHGFRPIDLLCVNLYPFADAIARPDATFDDAIENIDIGGPAMIRSAAKNHRWVLVVTSPQRYDKVLGDLREHGGSCCGRHRLKMAQRAFAHTAEYDARIAGYLAQAVGADAPPDATPDATPVPDAAPDAWPPTLHLRLRHRQALRYGENPHQPAALYVDEPRAAEASVAEARQLHGKELSYINLLDGDAALACVKEFDAPAACIVKHATPCGVACGSSAGDAFRRAFASDPLAAFGGIVALNRPVGRDDALAITAIDKLLEVIVAESYDAEAIDLLRTRWKNCRLLEVGAVAAPRDASARMLHRIVGGCLVQARDLAGFDRAALRVVTARPPADAEWRDLRVAWLACKHVKSNAIVLAADQATVGIGGGQVDRVGACGTAIAKAAERARGAVAASDAFFPFPDGPQRLIDAGVRVIIHPGGSQRDQESIDLCDRHDVAMVLTGRRHFRH